MPPTAATRAIEVDDSSHAIAPSQILRSCCENNYSCCFQIVQHEWSSPANFLRISPAGLEVLIATDEGRDVLRIGTICCISFPYELSFCVFLASISDLLIKGGNEFRIVLPVPQQIKVSNLRRLYRVPIISDAELTVTVKLSDDRSQRVHARDIAESGIEIDFGDGELPALNIGMLLGIELNYRDESAQRKAEVRRLDGTRCGLLFRPPSADVEREQSAALHNIVMSLQQLWLKSRCDA